MLKNLPTFKFEIPLWKQGFLVLGIDEVGRGALAGPLGVGGVAYGVPNFPAERDPALQDKLPISNSQFQIQEIERLGINDSKKLSAKKKRRDFEVYFRKQILVMVREYSPRGTRGTHHKRQDDNAVLFASTVHIDVDTINQEGISKAFQIGVQMLVDQCQKQFSNRKLFILIDGNFNFKISNINSTSKRSIIGGDGKSLSIAAASIIAKVTRDNYMKNLSVQFPEYGFDKHVGYGTPQHINAIKKLGKTIHHRDLFIRKILR